MNQGKAVFLAMVALAVGGVLGFACAQILPSLDSQGAVRFVEGSSPTRQPDHPDARDKPHATAAPVSQARDSTTKAEVVPRGDGTGSSCQPVPESAMGVGSPSDLHLWVGATWDPVLDAETAPEDPELKQAWAARNLLRKEAEARAYCGRAGYELKCSAATLGSALFSVGSKEMGVDSAGGIDVSAADWERVDEELEAFYERLGTLDTD